jgi:hypothetical protein
MTEVSALPKLHRNGKPMDSPDGKYLSVPTPLPNGAAGTEQTHDAGGPVGAGGDGWGAMSTLKVAIPAHLPGVES